MISPIAIMTEGWISPTTKKTITILSIGWLVFERRKNINNVSDDGEGYFMGNTLNDRKNKIMGIVEDDEDFLNIIKMWLQCR